MTTESRITYRPATADDQPAINALIREANINPMNLKWRNFLVAVDEVTGEIIGTGQIKTHGDGSRELASIATRPAYRGRGIARAIIRQLIAKDEQESTAPLYLTCVNEMPTFYEPFGFRVIGPDEMPRYFRRLHRLVGVMQWFARGYRFHVMKRDRHG